MIRRIGGHTIGFEEMPSIVGFASVAGKYESQGPLGKAFDKIIYDSYDGLDTYEQAESRFQSEAVTAALTKAKIKQTRLTAFSQAICSISASAQATV